MSEIASSNTSEPRADVSGSAAWRGKQAAMSIAWLVVFIDLLGFGIVLPVLPRQTEPYLANASVAIRGVVIGTLFSVFSLMQFVFNPVWGRISDRIGRKPVLLISLLGSVVFYALYGLAVSLPATDATLALSLMLLSRVGAGVAGASVGTAAAVIADCTSPDKRAKGMALIGVAFGAGFTLGPLIAYFGLELFAHRPWGVGVLASTLSFIALFIAIVKFRETRNNQYKAGKELFSIARTREVLQMPLVGKLVLIYFLVIFAFANFEATLALLTREMFGLTDRDNFLVFALVGGVLMFAGGMYRGIVKRHGERTMLTTGVGLMIGGLGALAIVASIAHGWRVENSSVETGSLKVWFYMAIATAVIGFAFVNPSVSALVSKQADPARQGEVMGVNQAFAALGRILGPFIGSVLFQVEASRTLPCLTAVVILILVGGLLPRRSSVADGP